MPRRKIYRRRRSNLFPRQALGALVAVLIVSFLLLHFLYKREAGDKSAQADQPKINAAENTLSFLEPELASLPPRVAIIIDDLGYSLRTVWPLLESKYPLTLAILPNLRYSLSIARKAKLPPLEAMLHLPLEPESEEYLEAETVMALMSEKEIRKLTRKHLESLLPHIKGVNNHMGSKVTADLRVMKIILEEVKKKNLYFIDSYTTTKSVIPEAARSLGVATAVRAVFLDLGPEGNNADYVRERLEELAQEARREGKAVGIGHAKEGTIEVLEEMMPKLAATGIQFVTASEVVE